VVLAHPGIADAAEGQVGDERLDRAVVDGRVAEYPKFFRTDWASISKTSPIRTGL
jgi:hypothetical protein